MDPNVRRTTSHAGRGFTVYMGALLLVLALGLGCQSASQSSTTPAEESAQSDKGSEQDETKKDDDTPRSGDEDDNMAEHISGRITVGSNPYPGAEVLLADEDGQLMESTTTGDDGSYQFTGQHDSTPRWVLARLRAEPAIGFRLEKVSERNQQVQFDVASSELVTLRGKVEMPKGADFDWAEVHFTPKPGDGVPKGVRKLLLKDPSGKGSRSVFASVETKQPEFELHVLKGKYRFEVDRVVYDAPMEKTWVLGGMEPDTPCTAEETTIGRICDFQQDYDGVVRLQELRR